MPEHPALPKGLGASLRPLAPAPVHGEVQEGSFKITDRRGDQSCDPQKNPNHLHIFFHPPNTINPQRLHLCHQHETHFLVIFSNLLGLRIYESIAVHYLLIENDEIKNGAARRDPWEILALPNISFNFT